MTTCDHCGRVFDSTSRNRVLSAAWVVRHWHVEDPATLQFKFGFSKTEVDLVENYVIDLRYSHDELVQILGKVTLDCQQAI
jgi:hypothetical protein